MATADAQPESLCAHEFEKADQSGFTTQWWRCKHCGAGKLSSTAGATPAVHTIIAEHQVGADAQTALGRAKEDARMLGIGFVVDGKRVSPQSVVVVREPRNCAQTMAEEHAQLQADEAAFEKFWLREGPSLAWDEDRKRAARRIWDAARKGGV